MMNQFQSSEDILAELEEQRDKNPDLYIPVPTQPKRTLLLIGSTRAGKSTICRTLRDSLQEPEKPTFYSATPAPTSQQIGGLRIIDMPGFNDVRIQTRNLLLTNKSILTMLQKQLKDNDPVHRVAFVFNINRGIKQEDIDAMHFVQSQLPNLAGRTMLVVTHAEELNDYEKDRMTEEFFDHATVKQHKLRNFFDKEILFIGCIRYESLNQLNYRAVATEHQNVLEMRKNFIEKCFKNALLPTKQQPIERYLWLLCVPVLILLFYMIYLRCGDVGLSCIIHNRNNISGSVHNSTMKDNMTFNETTADQIDADKKKAQINDANMENPECAPLSNMKTPSDDVCNNFTVNFTHDIVSLKPTPTTDDLFCSRFRDE
jgi:GTP-binding protein EngB required for normal cell division